MVNTYTQRVATLTETAYYARKYIRIGATLVVAFLILRIIFNAGIAYIRNAFPPTVRPDNAFSKLPAIAFGQSASPSAELTFTLQTIEGKVPEASSSATVYFMPKSRARLLSLSQAQSTVGRIDFRTSPKKLTDTLYRWVDLENPLRTIDFDIVSNHFTLTYLYQHELTLLTNRNIPTAEEGQKEAIEFFREIGVPMPDINTFSPLFQYLKLVGDRLEPATSQSQANAFRVDFFRIAYNTLPMVTDKPDEGNISIILSGSGSQSRRVLFAKYMYWPLLTHTKGVYKLKTSETAWLEFLDGKAYIAKVPPAGITNIPITKIYLAYYDGSIPQLFLQPVFVIESERSDFVAYVPAIAPPWTE